MTTQRANEITELIRRLGSRKQVTVDAARARLSVIGARSVEALIDALDGDNDRIRINSLQLLALIGDARNDILFVGYQAQGTPGRDIQRYGPRGGYVDLDGERFDIRAGVHTIAGYSAHADQSGLIDFVRNMTTRPQRIRLVHGEPAASAVLAERLRAYVAATEVAGQDADPDIAPGA